MINRSKEQKEVKMPLTTYPENPKTKGKKKNTVKEEQRFILCNFKTWNKLQIVSMAIGIT